MGDKVIEVYLSQDHPIPLDVNFSCGTGEILAILGPSGSGKTTILRSIAGLYTPQAGKISANGDCWFDSKTGNNTPVQKRQVGIVFQQYALFPHLSALQNICVPLSHLHKADQINRAEELLDRVNMQGLDHRYPHQLSGGQQQRVALARALARDPMVLLLDEPFSAVDQQTRHKLVRELVQLRTKVKIPIIHVTHDLTEARRIADRICIIHRGKILQIDAPQKIMAQPVNQHVARLVGQYNVFKASVERHEPENQKTYIHWLDHSLESPYRPELQIGEQVDWVIPAENLILHRRNRPSKGDRENPVAGEITEFIPLGENTSVTMTLKGSDETLSMSVPTHVARRNGLEIGVDIRVSLLSEGIHIMNTV